MTFFGPENPTPFCVVTENEILDHHENDSLLTSLQTRPKSNSNRYSFEPTNKYDQEFSQILDKHLEIECRDEILFILSDGDDGSFRSHKRSLQNWPKLIEKEYCLLKPIDQCVLQPLPVKKMSSLEYALSGDDDKVPFFKCHFSNPNNSNKKYDKIIVKNCIQLFDDDNYKKFCQFIEPFIKCGNKIGLKFKPSLLIIQRVCDLNTMPFASGVIDEWSINETKYIKLMETMQGQSFTVNYDIEIVKFLINCKTEWFVFFYFFLFYKFIKS
jgi:hypothetical protein